METKYNYVFFALDTDYYHVTYNDIVGFPFVRVKWSDLDKYSGLTKYLYRAHHSKKINRILRLPFKKLWFSSFFRNDFADNKPICFIFWGREAVRYGIGYLGYLKNKYPGCKIVITFWDLVKYTFNDRELEEYRKFSDLMFTYDLGDAQKYDMIYQHDAFSYYPINTGPEIQPCDVYFLVRAKDRLSEIVQAYDTLTSKGLKCDFYITAVEPADRIERSNIHYLEHEMPYIENLKHVYSANALLEILQGGSRGSTLRCCEAIAYGKALITNNAEVLNEPFYSEDRIRFFTSQADLESIDEQFVREKKEYNYINDLSPIAFIERLEEML